MNKQIENLIRKSFCKDIEIKILEKEINEYAINKEVIMEILKELIKEYE